MGPATFQYVKFCECLKRFEHPRMGPATLLKTASVREDLNNPRMGSKASGFRLGWVGEGGWVGWGRGIGGLGKGGIGVDCVWG